MRQIPWNTLSRPRTPKRLGVHPGNKSAKRAFREVQDESRAISCFPGVKMKAITTPTYGKALGPCLALTPASPPPQAQSHAFCMTSAIWEGKHKRNTLTALEFLP